MKTSFRALGLCIAVVASAPPAVSAVAGTSISTPQAVADELLSADRAFAVASAKNDLITGMSAMLDADVVMPGPGPKITRGKAQVVEALRSNLANVSSSAEWTPIRAGISADGQHGFTFGYMTLRTSGAQTKQFKYLSYWVKRPEGWRVTAFKRVPRPAGEVSLAPMAPALPERLTAPTTDTAAMARHRESLDRAERSFSDEAQKIGVGPAFQRNGSADAANMGTTASFTIGATNIGSEIGKGVTLPIEWWPDDVLVASSGDLGVSWGMIRIKGPVPEGQPQAFPYFTVWRKADPKARWLYIAE